MKQTRRFKTKGRLSRKAWTIRKSRMLLDHKKYNEYVLKQHKTYACYLRRRNRYNPMMEEVKTMLAKMPDYHPQ